MKIERVHFLCENPEIPLTPGDKYGIICFLLAAIMLVATPVIIIALGEPVHPQEEVAE